MDERIRIVLEDGKPIVRMKKDGIDVVITFSETEKESIKNSVVDILTNAYQNRFTA